MAGEHPREQRDERARQREELLVVDEVAREPHLEEGLRFLEDELGELQRVLELQLERVVARLVVLDLQRRVPLYPGRGRGGGGLNEDRPRWEPQVGALGGASTAEEGAWGAGRRPSPAVVEDCVGRQLQRHEDNVEAGEQDREPAQAGAPAGWRQGLQGGSRGCRVAAGKALRADGAGRVELGAA